MKMEDRILRHLQDFGSITSWEAIQEYHCTRLSHYIYLLRNKGYEIESKVICSKNRYGDNTHYTKYILKGE